MATARGVWRLPRGMEHFRVDSREVAGGDVACINLKHTFVKLIKLRKSVGISLGAAMLERRKLGRERGDSGRIWLRPPLRLGRLVGQ
ncbi:hypothetical protein E2C01_098706 [Portunus trituberculatus]|uniref:Uncharacterized protein n=1 Tax=Portunus trituberculatus TaxID=210409 RepID=A0A5B7K927_PORTR|nr:hypothetical protein [Portunus trituberculatus]